MYSDGFGLALLEAIACGLPAIASEVSTGPEIVTADCGFISPPGGASDMV
jgi:glycosyltransferase involved in cell wall biosynthesis